MIQLPITEWKSAEADKTIAGLLTRELGLHPIIAGIMASREIKDLPQAESFLSPSLRNLHSPFLMKGMTEGVSRVIAAIYRGETILVYGDYDADGITSVAILYDFLKKITPHVSYFIPDRVTQGYGLHAGAIKQARDRNVSLIITVDCGSSDHDQVLFAHSVGIDSVILDHHEIGSPTPAAVAVINPKQNGCPFPFKHLAAVGIVFNFLIALRGRLRQEGFYQERPYPNLKSYLDIVALGTIADITPLVDENRIFVKFGLGLISEGRRIGIRALKEISSLENRDIDSTKASFGLVPRINAAGRIASAGEAVELLLAQDLETARSLARKLDGYNRQRQALEREIFHDILAQAEELVSNGHAGSLVFASADWHPGVIGIVASRLVDRYNRPAILISLKDGLGKGSGRSLSHFNIYEGLKKLDSYLISFGGHQYAAGISIRQEDIEAFASRLDQMVKESMPIDYRARTIIDVPCQLCEISEDFMKQMELLAPFGVANPEPVLCSRAVSLSSLAVVGKNHLQMRLSAEGISHNCIWFGKAELSKMLTAGSYDVAFTPQINYYNGNSGIQLKLLDLSLS